MSCPRDYDDDEEDDLDDDDDGHDPEGPSPDEMDSHDEPDLDVFPHCRKMISEDAERCHHCGEYLIATNAPPSKPMWIVIAAVALLAVFLLAWFR